MSDVVIEVVADIEIVIEVIEVVIKEVIEVATEVTENYLVLLISTASIQNTARRLSASLLIDHSTLSHSLFI